MQLDYWHKQTPGQPLFPKLLWSRPENRLHAGKLLIIGGNLYGFSVMASAYSASLAAGAGTVRVALPDALAKTVGKIFPEAEFVTSTPSGSFGQKSLAELLEMSAWSDGVLLAGELGRNSETAILLEKFVTKYSGQLTVTGDALDYFLTSAKLLERPDTTLVATLAQLQKLATSSGASYAFTSEMGLLRLAEMLHDFTNKYQSNIVLKYAGDLLIASQGRVSSTKLTDNNTDTQNQQIAPACSVWWLQNPGQTFEALTSTVYAGKID